MSIVNIRIFLSLLLFTVISAAEEYTRKPYFDGEKINELNVSVSFDRYMQLHEIEAYLDSVVSLYPDIARLEQIGVSYEGRPLRVLHISRGSSAGKAGVFIDAGMHAREWLAPPVALYVIHQLTTLAEHNHHMLELAHWHVLPVANPDGYVYSWTTDRYWRLTRRPNKGYPNCTGVDQNRNFDVHWSPGSRNPCGRLFSGPHPMSEPEVRAIADFLRVKGRAGQLHAYLSLHAYAALLLYPHGYTRTLPSDQLIRAAEEAAAAAEAVRGTKFGTGSVARLLYAAYGSSLDYAYEVAGIPLSLTWELPPRRLPGPHPGGVLHLLQQFQPPPDQIRPVAHETWQGIRVIARHAHLAASRPHHVVTAAASPGPV